MQYAQKMRAAKSLVKAAPFMTWHGKFGVFVFLLGGFTLYMATVFWTWPSNYEFLIRFFLFAQAASVLALYFGLHATFAGATTGDEGSPLLAEHIDGGL